VAGPSRRRRTVAGQCVDGDALANVAMSWEASKRMNITRARLL
jgi:hypothetical protein